METFEEILTGGGHANSLGRANEVLDIVQKDPSRLDELYDCISSQDAWVRMRAIDTFEKLVKNEPELAQPYLKAIFTDLTKSSQPSIQWHLAQLFAEVELTEWQRASAITWLKDRISGTDVDWIVSVNTMKTLLYFYKKGLINSREVRSLFNVQTGHHSKSVRKKANTFLQELNEAVN